MNLDTCRATVIDVQTAVTLGDGNKGTVGLEGILINVILTGTCVITGFKDSSGAAKSITLPAGSAVGLHRFYGAVNEAGALTVTCSTVADADDVVALWNHARLA